MNNLLNLIKINLNNTYNISRYINNKNQKNRKLRIFGYGLLLVYLVVYFLVAIFMYASSAIKGYQILGVEHILLVQFMVVSSLLVLVTNIFKINGNLFNTKDFDLLSSMPIRNSTIIISKLATLYLESLMFTSFVMIPAFIVYVRVVSVSFLFGLSYFVTLFLIPIVPIVVATLIASLLAYISTFFRKRNIVNIIMAILLMVGSLYLSFSTSGIKMEDISDFGIALVNVFNRIYPLTRIYVDIVMNFNIISLGLYIIIPSVIFFVYLMVMKKLYFIINSKLSKIKVKHNFKEVKLNRSTPLKALFNKELKRYLSSYIYILNTSLGTLLMTISVIALVTSGDKSLDEMFKIQNLSEIIKHALPLLLCATCMLNSTTQASISLEGKSLSILKSLPVKTTSIFLSKILVNIVIVFPFILINASILTIYFKLSLGTYLISLILPFLSILFIAQLGLIANLQFPVLEWDNETRVIKQSMASFIVIMFGMVVMSLAVVLLIELGTSKINLFTIITSISLVLLNISLFAYLYKIGIKKFNAL